MLQQIRLQNFKIHTDTTVDLSPFTLLVGPNGSGKTSVLEGVYVLQQVVSGNKIGSRWQGFFVKKGEKKLTLGGHWKILDTEPQKTRFFRMVSLDNENPDEHNPAIVDENNRAMLTTVIISGSIYLKLLNSNLYLPSHFLGTRPAMNKDGYGLASTIAYLMTYDYERFLELNRLFQTVIPSVKKIRVRPAEVEMHEEREITFNNKTYFIPDTRNVIGHELIFDTVSGTEIPARAMSEGTLITLGILTAVMHPDCPNTVLLDDIEQGLHPMAQRDLMNTLKRLQTERPELQIIATTHSPYIVDELPLSAICVMACDDEGKIYAQTLDKHPDAERTLDVLTTGEFLSAEGESWVLPHG